MWMNNWMIGATALSLTLAPISAQGRPPVAPIKVNDCELLDNPAKFNKKMIEIESVAYSAFENFDLRPPCEGKINLELSPYTYTARKYGFETVNDSKMKELDAALFTDKDFMTRSRHHAKVHLVGLFRCHYDFPDCKNLSRDGDSSIVIRSVISVEKID
jgi:hypothetical protein